MSQFSFLSLSRASFRRLVLFFVLFGVGIPSLHAADSTTPTPSHYFDLRFETTTYVLDLEKQGLEDNTFTNGIGVDTTLIGDFLNVYLHRQLAPRLDADLGVFANIPFGFDTVVSQVRPIARLTYTPVDGVSARVGTLKVPHRDFHDAVFYYANRFVRPIEQGMQMLADLEFYRQDLFINWEQASGGSRPNRFDLGYTGELRAGPLRFNGQMHWVQNGQALFKLNRAFNTHQNIVTAFGPTLIIEPGRYLKVPDWWNEIGVRVNYLTSYNDPNETAPGPIVRGRGYDFQAWVDVHGFRPRVGFWRQNNFISQQGDPEFVVGNFMELGVSRSIALGDDASLEFGSEVRRIRHIVNPQTPQDFRWVNQHYFVFNWNWDTSRVNLLGDLFPGTPAAFGDSGGTSSPRRFSAKLDTLTYVYSLQYSGVSSVNGQPVSNATFAGEYLSPVLRYSPSSWLNLDAGFFVGLPVGSQQSFHTVQPILSAELEMLPSVSLVAGTLYRNHPFLDAIFNDAILFSRPIEQGFQLLVNRPHYQQDFFIEWNQVETSTKPEQFDLGYAGRLSHSIFGLNGQIYWAHAGGAQFSESRTILPNGLRNRSTANNFLAAVGPDVTLQPGDYWPSLSWVREVEVMAMYLTDQNQPFDVTQPVTRGRGYFLSAGIDADGWRPYVNFWRGENFVTERGDPAYFAGNFTEFGLIKDFVLPAGFTLRVGGYGRTLEGHVTHTEYALLNWSWDKAPWRGFCLRPTLLHLREKPCGLSQGGS